MANSVMQRLACVVLLCMVVSAPYAAEGAMSCSLVQSKLMPCLDYLLQGGSAVPLPCCAGVKSLKSVAQTTTDRQTACGCLKSLAAMVTGKAGNKPAYARATSIPGKCGVNIPYPISPSTDCAKVK